MSYRMIVFFHIALFVLAFCFMEFAAWFTHKYIMHGFLWRLHKDHHTGSRHVLEHNDWFSLIFGIPSFLLIFLGLKYNYPSSVWCGAGMAAYGAAYFIVHDIFIHQRLGFFRNINNNYLKALRRAHRMHHRYNTREKGESFGFLFVKRKYFSESETLFDKGK